MGGLACDLHLVDQAVFRRKLPAVPALELDGVPAGLDRNKLEIVHPDVVRPNMPRSLVLVADELQDGGIVRRHISASAGPIFPDTDFERLSKLGMDLFDFGLDLLRHFRRLLG